MSIRAAALGLVALMAGAIDARAQQSLHTRDDRCGDQATDPLAISFDAADFGSPRSACSASRDRVAVRTIVRPGGAADTTDFALIVRSSWKTRAGFELALGAQVLDYVHLKGSDLSTETTEFGPVVVAAADGDNVGWLGLRGRSLAELRLEIPRSNSALRLTAISASPSLTWTVLLSERIRIHNRGGLLLFSSPVADAVDGRASALLGSDVTARVSSWMIASAGLEAQAAIDDLGLDHALVRGGFRFGTTVQATVALSARLAGNEDSVAALVVGLLRER